MRALLLVVTAVSLLAQPKKALPSSRTSDDDQRGAWIQGTVISDFGGQPLNRAIVTIRPVSGATSPVVAETDDSGVFRFTRIAPGSYRISAQRDGYLEAASARRGSFRLPPILLVRDGLRVRDLTFRLRPWAVISGKIRYDDGEPAVGAAVQVYREISNRTRRTMQQVQSARANDRGEFRIHGLAAGGYLIAATRVRSVAPDLEEQEALDSAGREVTAYRYATTFYPAAQRLSDAVVVRVEPAQEIGALDITLKPAPSVRIRGRVTNGITGDVMQGAALTLRRVTADALSSIPVSVIQKPWKDGFELSGVTSGPYVITAESEVNRVRISTRHQLTVTDAPIDNLELVLTPDRQMYGTIRAEDNAAINLSSLRVTLEPRSDLGRTAYADPVKSGLFRSVVSPNDRYDAYVANLPDTWYIKRVQIANSDATIDGIPGSAAQGEIPVLDILVSSKAGVVAGRAYTSDGGIASGASVVLVPDPARGRGSAYNAGDADQYGIFEIRGVAPGRYTAFSFYDDPPCDYYDESALLTCRSNGRTVEVKEAERAVIEIRQMF